MNVELKPIAESKVRQLGGDVCGVLVRKDGRLAAVDEYGRVQWLQDGQGAEASDTEKLRCQQCGNMEPFHATGCKTEFGSYSGATPQPEADEWIECSERLPTDADADIFGNVWCSGFWDNPNLGIAPINWSNVGKGSAGDTHWKPTGLKRPQPPKEGGADEH